ncbi:MAG: hypothetical protein AAFQ80_09635 [Cyanobacteria bacterium J06621_8]
MNLETNILRIMWKITESANPYKVVSLSDKELINNVISKVETAYHLSSEELGILHQYVTARIPLIRDLAYSKIAC